MYLYGSDSITRIIYSANATFPFKMEVVDSNTGCDSHHSIVNAMGYNYFFNRNYGFIKYGGESTISSDNIISKDITNDLKLVYPSNYHKIIGKYIPYQDEIVWAIPIAANNCQFMYFYNISTGNWRVELKTSSYIDMWTRATNEYKKPVFANTDGITYQIAGETFPLTSNIDGYRIEPVMDFGAPMFYKRVQELRFGIVSGGDYSIDCSWRTGNTVKELLTKSWTSIGSLSLNNPLEPMLRLDQSGRYHQLKWGTDVDSEPFSINWIEFVYGLEDD
jgi:hypothetical protein